MTSFRPHGRLCINWNLSWTLLFQEIDLKLLRFYQWLIPEYFHQDQEEKTKYWVFCDHVMSWYDMQWRLGFWKCIRQKIRKTFIKGSIAQDDIVWCCSAVVAGDKYRRSPWYSRTKFRRNLWWPEVEISRKQKMIHPICLHVCGGRDGLLVQTAM